MKKADIIIKNANQLVTLKGPNRPRIKNEMNNLSIISNGSVAIKDGKIVEVGKNLEYQAEKTINAKGKTVLPGFVDCHTHLVFAGSREFELDWKLKGFSYMDIKKKGGGIQYTVEKTRMANEKQLFKQSTKRLEEMIKHGTTTCEAKTGYGLDMETELKILDVQEKLNDRHPVDIISTFLGAHSIPKEYKNNKEEYIEILIKDMLPKVKDKAFFCDVFCEKGFFTIEESRKILQEGKRHGMVSKIHADEIVDTGGASLAADLGAISAEHLLKISKKGIKDMANKRVIGVMLPGTPFSLMMNKYAPVRDMIGKGVPIAIATELNPNCWTENMQMIIQLACFNMKMTPAEAVTAATFNASCAIKKQDEIGSIEKGKQADVIILDSPNYKFLPYHFGINQVEKIIKKGKLIK
ncbi:MAG: imidazolonepropionase [Candidatus Thermoplasmatota archaeon]